MYVGVHDVVNKTADTYTLWNEGRLFQESYVVVNGLLRVLKWNMLVRIYFLRLCTFFQYTSC